MDEAVLDALQALADKRLLPIDRVTAFTLIVEGIDYNGEDIVLDIAGPHDYITTTLGHLRYMTVKVEAVLR